MRFIASSVMAFSLLSSPAFAQRANTVTIHSDNIKAVVETFMQLNRLAMAPTTTTASTTCGYIFPGDASKFGCTGKGRAAADVAAACSGGGQLACTGSGSNRTCTCAFD